MTRLRQARNAGLALALALTPLTAKAQDAVLPTRYADVASTSAGRVTFDTLPQQPEPGVALNAPMRLGALWLAQHFAGQRLTSDTPFDRVTGTPIAPLVLRPGPPGQNQSVAHHRGFGSNALFPLGSRGYPDIRARGEGAVALLFDDDQTAVGLRIHADYADPLGQRPAQRGTVTLILYRRDGSLIARHTTRLDTGITDLALRRARDIPDIAGMLILNDDPGGIAIDDILYQIAPKLG